MDRIALSKRLEGLSVVFASGTPIHRDLKAMSHVLAEMPEEKFAKVLNPEYKPDEVEAKLIIVNPGAESDPGLGGPGLGGPGGVVIPGGPGGEEKGTCPMSKEKGEGQGKGKIIKKLKDIIQEEEGASMEANQKTAGTYWNKEASTAVANNLLRDVLGMEKSVCCKTPRDLPAGQKMDGHMGTVQHAANLTAEQTPVIKDVLKSDMYAKSKGAVRKEATEKTDKDAGQNADLNKSKNIPANVDAIISKTEGLPKDASTAPKAVETPKAAEASKTEEAPKVVDAAKADKKDADKKESCNENEASTKKEASDNFMVEGIEMVPTMEEVVLSKDEEARLSKLF